VKRRELVRYLEALGCQFLREGGNHSVYVNRRSRKASSVPRHSEINDGLVRKICKDLDVPVPQKTNPKAENRDQAIYRLID
jgi:predicted RNA binding protein YcfA (HicA-like mRNA interferase family)